MGLTGGDRRLIHLVGGDGRLVRLVGGDRLAPRPQLVSGTAALLALAAAGASTVAMPSAGAGALAELLGGGRGTVAMPAAGGGALLELVGGGASTVVLPAAGAGPLAELLGGGGSTVALPGAGGALLAEMNASGGASAFRPQDVAEVAAGYFWDPLAATGSGTAAFVMPEGNGKTSYNQITPSLAAAPAISTVNGRAVIQHFNRVPDSLTRTATQLARGWTGATYMFGWFSCGAVGPGLVLGHWRSNANIEVAIGTARVDVGAHDGVANREAQHAMPAGWLLAGPFFLEALFDPLPVTTNRLQVWVNRLQITPSVAASMGTTLRDSTSFLHVSGSAGDASTFNISADFAHGVVGIVPGIPSAADRDRLFNHRRLAA